MVADVSLVAGRRDRFAIEAVVEETVDDWVLGHLRFWLCDKSVGNWGDTADLSSCVRWLRDFADVPRDRCQPELYAASAEEVFKQLYDPVIAVAEKPAAVRSVAIERAFERFHISHLGVSSFDSVDMLLMQDLAGRQRCLWRQSDSTIEECRLEQNEMETVAREFCELFERSSH